MSTEMAFLFAVVQACIIGGMSYFARTVLATAKVVERLDERTLEHRDRLRQLERKVA